MERWYIYIQLSTINFPLISRRKEEEEEENCATTFDFWLDSREYQSCEYQPACCVSVNKTRSPWNLDPAIKSRSLPPPPWEPPRASRDLEWRWSRGTRRWHAMRSRLFAFEFRVVGTRESDGSRTHARTFLFSRGQEPRIRPPHDGRRVHAYARFAPASATTRKHVYRHARVPACIRECATCARACICVTCTRHVSG